MMLNMQNVRQGVRLNRYGRLGTATTMISLENCLGLRKKWWTMMARRSWAYKTHFRLDQLLQVRRIQGTWDPKPKDKCHHRFSAKEGGNSLHEDRIQYTRFHCNSGRNAIPCSSPLLRPSYEPNVKRSKSSNALNHRPTVPGTCLQRTVITPRKWIFYPDVFRTRWSLKQIYQFLGEFGSWKNTKESSRISSKRQMQD